MATLEWELQATPLGCAPARPAVRVPSDVDVLPRARRSASLLG